MAFDSGGFCEATAMSEVPRPAGWAGGTAETSGKWLIVALSVLVAGEPACAPMTTSTGEVRFGG